MWSIWRMMTRPLPSTPTYVLKLIWGMIWISQLLPATPILHLTEPIITARRHIVPMQKKLRFSATLLLRRFLSSLHLNSISLLWVRYSMSSLRVSTLQLQVSPLMLSVMTTLQLVHCVPGRAQVLSIATHIWVHSCSRLTIPFCSVIASPSAHVPTVRLRLARTTAGDFSPPSAVHGWYGTRSSTVLNSPLLITSSYAWAMVSQVTSVASMLTILCS